jgi:taurine dioxygenase
MSMTVSHARLEPFGVEAKIDTPSRLTSADKDELRRLLALDGLLVIRGLKLNLDQQIEFCSMFGSVLRTEGETYVVSNSPGQGILGDHELVFHVDIPYVPAPYWVGALYAVETSGDISPTRFASGLRAYERLPQALRARIDGLNTLQVKSRVRDRRNRLTDMVPGDNCAVQALVGRQRGTERPYLFAGAWHTESIIGLPAAESEQLLAELFSYHYAADNIYDHDWHTGDIVIWDNCAVQHARMASGNGTRTLQRVSTGPFAYWDQYPLDRGSLEKLATVEKPAA